MSDDWVPCPKWDDLIIERIGDLNKHSVLAISDGSRTDDLLCMAICTRAYWTQDYFLFHPWFKSVYSDNWFTELAYKRGQVIQARDIVSQHNHPVFGKAEMDETYAQQNAPERYVEGRALYEQLQQGNDWSSVPGFFNYYNFYSLIAEQLKDGDRISEVGVRMGRSIIYLAQLLKRQGKKVKIYAVDHFKGESNLIEHAATVALCGGNIRTAFEANIKRCVVEDMIEILDGESHLMGDQIRDNSLAFFYIDAAHDYESVLRDIKAWRPKVEKGKVCLPAMTRNGMK